MGYTYGPCDALDGNRGYGFIEAFTLSHLGYSTGCHARIIPASEEILPCPRDSRDSVGMSTSADRWRVQVMYDLGACVIATNTVLPRSVYVGACLPSCPGQTLRGTCNRPRF